MQFDGLSVIPCPPERPSGGFLPLEGPRGRLLSLPAERSAKRRARREERLQGHRPGLESWECRPRQAEQVPQAWMACCSFRV
jgi:hypothetical protein